MMRSRYSSERRGNFVLITDKGGGKSVTNDAEFVIRDLVELGINVDATYIIYRDSMGFWDQLYCKDGEFESFRPLRTKTPDEAMQRALNLMNGE